MGGVYRYKWKVVASEELEGFCSEVCDVCVERSCPG